MRQVLFFLVVFLSVSVRAQSLVQRLDTLLHEEVLRTSEVGITVFDLTAGKSLYCYQDEKLYRPASVEKVVTSVTALAQLGTDYTMDTGVYCTGRIENDTLKGSLYVVGGFDPVFLDEDMDRLVEALQASGIRYVTDSIVADVSMMDSLYWGPGWSWDDTPYSFQPYLSPLILNRGCVDVTVSPSQKDSLPRVVCMPASDYYTIENRGVSHNSGAGKLEITRNWLNNGNVIRISGNVTRTSKETLNIYPSQDYFFHTFANRLREKGIHAPVYVYGECPQSGEAVTILRRPIREVLKEALKESDNLCAESMFYHLAKRHAARKRVGSKDGTDAINAFMKTALGMDPERYKIADGSGVSLYNYISPRLLLAYLRYADAHREIFQPFYECLPIAGIDGTLKNRMKQTRAKANVHAKTGTVTGVSSLAGYVRAANGHRLAFVIINQNVLKLSRARAFQDKVCDILVSSTW